MSSLSPGRVQTRRGTGVWPSSNDHPTVRPLTSPMLSSLILAALALLPLASAHGYITSHKARMVSARPGQRSTTHRPSSARPDRSHHSLFACSRLCLAWSGLARAVRGSVQRALERKQERERFVRSTLPVELSLPARLPLTGSLAGSSGPSTCSSCVADISGPLFSYEPGHRDIPFPPQCRW